MMRQSSSTSDRASGDFTVSVETFDSLPDPVHVPGSELEWASPFVLPGWLHAWWEVFAPPAESLILSVREGGRLIGIAPFQREGGSLRLIGGADVCDHLDVVVDPRRKKEFCGSLLDYVSREGVTRIDLGPVRSDSAVMTGLVPQAREREWTVASKTEDVLFETDLPPPGRNTWIGCPASSATRSDASSDGWSKAPRSRFDWWAAAGRSPPASRIF